MILFIDTSGSESHISLKSAKNEVVAKKSSPANNNQSEELLSEIDTMLAGCGHTKGDLSGIEVVAGPGSYTGIRVGVATANALAFALGIPILPYEKDPKNNINKINNHLSTGLFVFPIYKNPPYITKPRA